MLVWDSGEVLRPAHPLRRAAALALDAVLLGLFLAWLRLPAPGFPPWAMLLLAGAYVVVAEGWRGRTIGKKAAALDVRSATDGGPAGLRRALVRNAVRLAPAVPAIAARAYGPDVIATTATALAVAASTVDHAWVLRDRLGRTLHDLAAGTVVLRWPRPVLFRLEPGHPWARGDGPDQRADGPGQQ